MPRIRPIEDPKRYVEELKAEQKLTIEERKQRDRDDANKRLAEQERIRKERKQAELEEIERRLYAYHVQGRDMPEDEWNQRKDELVREEYNRLLDQREQRTVSSLKRRIARAF